MFRSELKMRTITLLLGMILAISMSSVNALASGDAVPAKEDPIQAGYAIITPDSTNTAGLVAFETFGQKQGSGSTQAGVLPAAMTTQAMLYVSTSGRLSRNLGVAIANPGTEDAIVTLTLRGADGVSQASTDVTVPAMNQLSKFVTELFSSKSAIVSDFTGTLYVTSDNPVAIIGLRFRGNNFSTLPSTSIKTPVAVPNVSAGIGGDGAVILPQFATGGGWATEIVLANAGTIKKLVVRIDLFGQDGKPLVASLNGKSDSSFIGIEIPAGGTVTLAPRDSNGDSEF